MVDENRLKVWVGKVESTTPGRRGDYKRGHRNPELANSKIMNCFCIEAEERVVEEEEENRGRVASSRSLRG